MTKLPEPYTIEWTKTGWVNKFYVTPPDDGAIVKPLFSEAQMLQFRRDALEEAAMVCDEHLQYPSLTPKHCADHIRALKGET
jgi:hypothetical protein